MSEPDLDLFGHVITTPAPVVTIPGKRRETRPNGYAAPPGTGPLGETCRTCAHKVRKEMGGSYLKCNLMFAAWTCGPGTDILARSPACHFWKRKTDA